MADEQDIYGTDLRLTDSGDIALTASGDLQTITGPEVCVQALTSRVRTYPGELPLHPEYGSHMADRLIGTHRDQQLAESVVAGELRILLREDERFTGARNITVDTSDPEAARVAVTLLLTAGDRVTVDDLSDPSSDLTIEDTASDGDPFSDPFDDDLDLSDEGEGVVIAP